MKSLMFSQTGTLKRDFPIALRIFMSVLVGFTGGLGHAQLAITEVMADASPSSPPFRGPDFWELTNFGPEFIPLEGFSFRDNNPGLRIWEPFAGVVIQPGESIIFCRTNLSVSASGASFAAWWGAAGLPAGLRVFFYVTPGFDGTVGDELWLLDGASNVVDMVRFGGSLAGRSKTYDAVSGLFDRDSEPGVGGAFRSVLVPEDIGSPGWTPGPVPIAILQQPASQTIDCCGPVSFSVQAGGIPRPAYQWTSNNIPIPGATTQLLHLPAVAPDSGGTFRVIVSTSQEQRVSSPAVLTVNTTPMRPSFVAPLEDASLFPGQSVRLGAAFRGFPIPRCQWFSNGVVLAGATNSAFTVATVAGALPTPLGSASYTLVLSNSEGRAESSARVTVMRRPVLQITEVMPDPTNSTALPVPGLKPWFEVINNDTNAVNLKGYRFRDSADVAVASIISSNLILQPGESMIFVDSMSAESFVRWWGDDRLPRGLQVVPWFGWSLSSRGDDVIHFWNAHPAGDLDTVATGTYLTALAGYSQELLNFYDDTGGSTGIYNQDSGIGVNGAFSSLMATNVGSPGFIDFPDPFFTRITRNASGVQLRCRFTPGRRYRLYSRDRFDAAATWTTVQTVTATNIVMMLNAPLPATAARFYRLEELP